MSRSVLGASTNLRRRALVLLASLLAGGVLSMALASGASALSLGLMWSGNNSFSATEMEAVQRSGASVFHMPIELNGTSNGADWSVYDPIFEAARQHGITIAPVLIRTNAEGNRFPVAAEFPAWNAWVGKVVKRYGPGGDFWSGKPNPRPATVWSVWNEPNLPASNPLNGANPVQPENYGRFLVSTAAAIRNVHGGAAVLVGGLFTPGGEFYSSFLQEMASVPGGPTAYDGVNIHPYSFYGKIPELAEQVDGVRFALDHHVAGGAGKPLWIGELGWPVANPSQAAEDKEFKEGKRSKPGVPPVSEAAQATLLIESFDWIKTEAAANNIQAAFWYNVRDAPLGPRWDSYCGLRDLASGSLRRAWWAFQEETGAPFWPVASNWFSDNLGGTITSDPDISSWGPDRIDVFAKGVENALWTRTWNGSGWSAWGFLGGTLTSGPGAVSWGKDRIDVVARAADGSVAHAWWNGAGWFSDNLGGSTPSDPDVSSWGPDRLDVFVRGAENSLWHRFWNGAWSVWEYLGGAITSGPGSVSWGNDRIDVVARAADGSVAHWWWAGGWHTDNLGGTIVSRPTIASPEPGRLDVFGQGVENGLWHKEFKEGSGWSAWERVGGPITSAPGAVSTGPTRIDVVARVGAGSVGHWWWLRP